MQSSLSTEKPLHVLITVNVAWNVYNFRQPILRSLLDAGHRVTVLAPMDKSVAALTTMGCHVIPLRMSQKGLNPFEAIQVTKTMAGVFRSQQPDVVFAYTVKNNIFGAAAAKSCGIPFLPNVTGLGTAFLSGRMLRMVAEILHKCAFHKLETVFFQNEDDLQLFEQCGLVKQDQGRVLPGSGVDLEHFAPVPHRNANPEVNFLMVSRVLRDKGIFEFVEAARLLRAEGLPVNFKILGKVGAANRTSISRDVVDAWHTEGVIEYVGTTPDVRPHIAASDCVVLPSYREGAPRALIEASAMARPIIATDVPGCRSVVDQDKSGLLCAARSGSSLAQACRKILAMTHDERAEMGQAGRRKMERHFGQEHIVSAYREATMSVLGRSF